MTSHMNSFRLISATYSTLSSFNFVIPTTFSNSLDLMNKSFSKMKTVQASKLRTCLMGMVLTMTFACDVSMQTVCPPTVLTTAVSVGGKWQHIIWLPTSLLRNTGGRLDSSTRIWFLRYCCAFTTHHSVISCSKHRYPP